jgi:hypothetical protein
MSQTHNRLPVYCDLSVATCDVVVVSANYDTSVGLGVVVDIYLYVVLRFCLCRFSFSILF